MQPAPPIVAGVHAPPGEPLPLVVWLATGDAGLVDRLRHLGAYVAVTGARDPGAWPAPVAAAVDECRRRFARAYVIRRRDSPGGAVVAAGLRDTPANDADPWSVALLAGAARDAGLAAAIDPARPGAAASDELQGFELSLPAEADDALIAIAGALADGLRVAQLKC